MPDSKLRPIVANTGTLTHWRLPGWVCLRAPGCELLLYTRSAVQICLGVLPLSALHASGAGASIPSYATTSVSFFSRHTMGSKVSPRRPMLGAMCVCIGDLAARCPHIFVGPFKSYIGLDKRLP